MITVAVRVMMMKHPRLKKKILKYTLEGLGRGGGGAEMTEGGEVTSSWSTLG